MDFPDRTTSIEVNVQRHFEQHQPKNTNEHQTPQNIQSHPQQLQLDENDTPPMHEEYTLFKGLMGCMGGLLIHLVIASLYQWSSINIYITSYFRIVKNDPSITLESNAIIYPVMMICIGFTMRLGLYLAKQLGPMKVLIGANLICSLTVFVSSFMESSFLLFILFYGIVFGLGAGLTFMIPIVHCNKYFPGKKMKVNGFILVGTGLGACVFGTFAYNFINPEEHKPIDGYYEGTDQLVELAMTVPMCLRYLSLMYFCIGSLGNLMIWPLIRYNQDYAKTHRVIEIGEGDAESISEGLTSVVFWKKVLVLIGATCGIFFVTGNYKTYAKTEIEDDGFLTLIGTIGAIGNGFSRFLWNLLFSKTGYKFVMTLNILLTITILITIRFTLQYPTLFLFVVFLTYCSLGGYLVITPTFSQALFGPEVGSNIYGFFWTTYSIANFIQYGLVNTLKSSLGFDGILNICIVMAIFVLPIMLGKTWRGVWGNKTLNLEFFYQWEKQKEEELERLELQEAEREEDVSAGELIHIQKLKSQRMHSHKGTMKVDECLSEHCHCHKSKENIHHHGSEKRSILVKKSKRKFTASSKGESEKMEKQSNQPQQEPSHEIIVKKNHSLEEFSSKEHHHLNLKQQRKSIDHNHSGSRCIRWLNEELQGEQAVVIEKKKQESESDDPKEGLKSQIPPAVERQSSPQSMKLESKLEDNHKEDRQDLKSQESSDLVEGKDELQKAFEALGENAIKQDQLDEEES